MKKNLSLSTAIAGLVFSATLMIGCSSKPVKVAETKAPATVAEPVVAENTNLGASSSGFSR